MHPARIPRVIQDTPSVTSGLPWIEKPTWAEPPAGIEAPPVQRSSVFWPARTTAKEENVEFDWPGRGPS